ncbi:hypothetical protein [Clostridium tagluense]|uniref:hypothetical protein n=1 Tax=Clostridium tagluense TaxID=360422 RepID=UPI001CF1F47C|nr:hypothetical protein [Clostridium tagluense]MCB2300138.1 hypothetical protein [Clostridium tagluense]
MVKLRAMTADSKAQLNDTLKKLHEQQSQSQATQDMYDEKHKQQEDKEERLSLLKYY